MNPELKQKVFEWIEAKVSQADNPEEAFEAIVETVLDMDDQLSSSGITWLDRVYATRVNQETA